MAAEHPAHDEHDSHPGVGQYIEIGAILALLTAIEVSLFFADIASAVEVPALLFLTVLKFVLVILWFMHLRFDHKVFRRLFFTGVALAGVVFSVVLVISG
ncbi:MAG TPA: cytochrome C oxidase subunit IV family protein [Egibacteraceae bacterium]|nr:cytochrome C oxidase subunit IV family protein [Egibacteraceae bacterium]